MKRLIRYIMCACILHKILISEACPDEWFDALAQDDLADKDKLNQPTEENTNM